MTITASPHANSLTNGREVSLLLAYLAHEVRAQAGDESVAFDG